MEIKMDPCKKFTDVKVEKIIEAVGILPVWVDHAYTSLGPNPKAREVFDSLMDQYKFGFGDGTEMKAGIAEDGTWVSEYEEDADLYPLVSMAWDSITVYVYQYSLVGIVGPETTLLTRMD